MDYIITEELPPFIKFARLHEDSGLLKNKKGNYTREQLYKAAKNSWYSVSIYNDQKLIAFGRMISDGVYQALICDVMVHPDEQGKGLGKQIIEKLVSKCQQSGIQSIQLFSAKGKHPFYKKLGFIEREQDAPGMSLHL
ncbi:MULTISPECIES: GNAT family N-acetyltransferase [Niallia]|jgi:N-acetylglutamate synthase-like GNAT family acetyltransferase|uniref:GNAT family N-acetyltransferase n=1 Tax=Niallia circulans TaxID=1397 RepID=A0A268FH63_NIACI|nr:GNAT family N-acetyltransferase [Niallia circulans]AYV66528.1 N-acetyltransferase [Niallia circulans]AYV70652.1 N-acetyltransferase [Niallia circulans]NRG27449.1 GNAT family N-acetyltransferase [Niallia circulans]PAD84726.1 GNAT family N-acetyltransferase [Niallia circulans]QJX62417.1 GNAT family N-acetyltransferase [Niallia circulans]